MSRGFIKETDQEEVPLLTPRAHLPDGAVNYVTVRGLRLLREEESALQAEITRLSQERAEEHRVQINYLRARLSQLVERLQSARLVEPDPDSPLPAEVVFGSVAEVEESGVPGTTRYTIVGVDEAAPQDGLYSYLSPVVRALLGCRPGDQVELRTPRGPRLLTVVAVEWERDA